MYGVTSTEAYSEVCMSEYDGDACSFFTYIGEIGPSVYRWLWDLLLFWFIVRGFLWFEWEGVIVQDVVDYVLFGLIFFPV